MVHSATEASWPVWCSTCSLGHKKLETLRPQVLEGLSPADRSCSQALVRLKLEMPACFPQPPFSPYPCQGHPSSHTVGPGTSCSQHLRLLIITRMEPWLCSWHSGPGSVHPGLSSLTPNWGQSSPRPWSCSVPSPPPLVL